MKAVGRMGDVLALCAYAALTAWWLWPLPPRAADHMITNGPTALEHADQFLILWALAWGVHALTTSPWTLFDANTFHPSSLSLAYSEHLLGHQALFAPAYLVTDNAVLAGNVVLVGGQVLSACGAYALARRFVPSPAAFVTGALYAFCAVRYDALYHFHVLGVQYLPLVLLFTERWLESARRADALLLGLVLILQVSTSVYLAYATGFLYAVYLPLALWRWRRSLDRRRLVGLGGACVVTMAVLVATSWPYLELRRLGLIPSYGLEEALPRGITFAPRFMERFLRAQSIGWIGYLLVGLALVPPRRASAWACTIGVAAVVTGVLTGTGMHLRVGPWHLPTPYPWLVDWIPGFAAVRLPARLALVAQLGFSLLAGIGTARVLARVPPPARWPLALAGTAAVLWSLGPWSPHRLTPVPVGATVPPPYAWLAEHGQGGPVLELPPGDALTSARRMYLSTTHWLPVIGGYSAYPPRSTAYLERLARGLPEASALQALVDAVDVEWIVVHLDQLPAARRWQLPAGLAVAGRWPDALVLRVTRRGEPALQARLHSREVTMAGTPRTPLGAHCPGRLEAVGHWPASIARLTSFVASVRVHNDGTDPWPAFGFVPRHLLHLRSCMYPAHADPCLGRLHPLPADVRPGHAVDVRVPIGPPAFFAGRYRVRLELVQLGDGSLDRCGVQPLVVPVTVRRDRSAGAALTR